jgi:general stress protein 26
MGEDVKKEVWSYFKNMQTVFLATSDDEQARVRPVTMIHFNKKLWVGTSAGCSKVKQLKRNNKAEFCLYIEQGEQKQGYVRGLCSVDIIDDEELKKQLADQMPYFKYFWKGYDDPKYTLLQFNLKEIEFLNPGTFKIKKISL